jgi:hypothetical protein
MIRMPGNNPRLAATLSPEERALRQELVADVQKLGGDIGERNLSRYAQLNEAAALIEKSFVSAGLVPRRDSYDVNGKACHNIEVEIRGSSPEIVPSPGLGAFYPTTGNFIGLVGNVQSRALLRRVITVFRGTGKLPAEGAALPAFIPGSAGPTNGRFGSRDTVR